MIACQWRPGFGAWLTLHHLRTDSFSNGLVPGKLVPGLFQDFNASTHLIRFEDVTVDSNADSCYPFSWNWYFWGPNFISSYINYHLINFPLSYKFISEPHWFVLCCSLDQSVCHESPPSNRSPDQPLLREHAPQALSQPTEQPINGATTGTHGGNSLDLRHHLPGSIPITGSASDDVPAGCWSVILVSPTTTSTSLKSQSFLLIIRWFYATSI